jgi:hypothetical protein
LDFFRKGTNYFLQVLGKGWVVADPEEMNKIEQLPEGAKKKAINEMVLVKVKIMKAEYYEKNCTPQTWWQNALNTVATWFRTGHYRPDTFFPAS